MNAVVARGSGQSNALARLRPALVASFLLGLAISGARAFEGDPSSVSAVPAATEQSARLQLDVSASSLPRFDSADGSTRAARIDLTWLPPRRSALGLSLGMTTLQGPAFSASGPYVGSAPAMDIGLRWRYTLDSNYRVDVAAWRRLVPTDTLALVQMQQPSYGARVEMQIRSAPKRGFVAERGFLGLQLESGARVTLRRSAGKPMLYYRTNF